MVDLLRTLLSPGYGAYVLDKDGTLLNQSRPINGASDFLRHLHARGIPHVILTNTGEKTRAQVAESISRVLSLAQGVVDESRVVTARDVALRQLNDTMRFSRTFVIGKAAEGHDAFDWRRRVPDDASGTCLLLLSDGVLDDFVHVAQRVGEWMANGASLWASSSDDSITTSNGSKRPGPGAFLHAVQCLLRPNDAKARTRIFGKGGDDVANVAEEVMRCLRNQGFRGTPRQVLAVGDRFDSDMHLGKAAGWSTCLVESGCHQLSDAVRFRQTEVDEVAASVRDLITHHEHAGLAATMQTIIARSVDEGGRHLRREWLEWAMHRTRRALDRLEQRTQPPPRRIHSCPDITSLNTE